MFTLIGPHSPFGTQSLFTISETQIDYALGFIELWRRGKVDAASPSPEATTAYNAELRAAIPNTIWASGCKSWYIGKDGLPHAWPWTPERHREMLRRAEARGMGAGRRPGAVRLNHLRWSDLDQG